MPLGWQALAHLPTPDPTPYRPQQCNKWRNSTSSLDSNRNTFRNMLHSRRNGSAVDWALLRCCTLRGEGEEGMAGEFLGAWRIVEMEVWDRDYLDLVVPAHITFEPGGLG